MSDKVQSRKAECRRLQAPMLARRGELHQTLESFNFTRCASMADPLDSGDDVSVNIKSESNTSPDTDPSYYSDLRQAQKGRGPKAARGED